MVGGEPGYLEDSAVIAGAGRCGAGDCWLCPGSLVPILTKGLLPGSGGSDPCCWEAGSLYGLLFCGTC